MSLIYINAVVNTDNWYKLTLLADGVAINHTLITSAHLRSKTGTLVAASLITPTIWDFTNAGYLLIQLGKSDIPVGIHTYVLVVQDSSHPLGTPWETLLYITMHP